MGSCFNSLPLLRVFSPLTLPPTLQWNPPLGPFYSCRKIVFKDPQIRFHVSRGEVGKTCVFWAGLVTHPEMSGPFPLPIMATPLLRVVGPVKRGNMHDSAWLDSQNLRKSCDRQTCPESTRRIPANCTCSTLARR